MAVIGGAKLFLGRGEETEPHINEALRLSPRDVFAPRWMAIVGFAKEQLGADAEAIVWLRRALDANRNHSTAHFDLAAVLARLGELDEARATVQAGLALDPSFTIRRFRDATNARSDVPTFLAWRDRAIEGMRLAGYLRDDDCAHINASLTSPTHPCHTEPIHGSFREKHVMTKVPPANFNPELVTIMKSALDAAVDRIDRTHRTPATKAKMAQRIVRTASEGVTDMHM